MDEVLQLLRQVSFFLGFQQFLVYAVHTHTVFFLQICFAGK
jgi:hypothetical protein